MGSLPFAKLRQQGRLKKFALIRIISIFMTHLPCGSFTAT
jgi:hypothetical protein